MADSPRTRFTDAEYVLINAMTSVLSAPVVDASHEDLMLQLIDECVPECDRGHRYIAPLVEAAVRLLRAKKHSGDWTWARMDANAALGQLSEWRAGLFWDRMRKAANGQP